MNWPSASGVVSDLITICISTYRRPIFLLRCLRIPARSTGTLVKVMPLPAGVTVHCWRNPPSTGPVERYRNLLGSAGRDRLVWMNDDDVLLPGAVTALSDAFSSAIDVIVSYGHEQIMNTDGEVLPDQTARSNIEYRRLGGIASRSPGRLLATDLPRRLPNPDRGCQEKLAFAAGRKSALQTSDRLAQAYKGARHVFINRTTIQSRTGPSIPGRTSHDAAWKYFQCVTPPPRGRRAGKQALSPESSGQHASSRSTVPC